MTHRGASLIRVAATIAAGACARHAAPDAEARAAAARSADSARVAAADRSRSSATQVATFTVAESARFTRVEQMLAARFPSVRVVPQGNEYVIQIRGAGSLGAASNEPLVIIDGAHRSTADLRAVDTRDVARIEVIKDGAAALYGVRGANGVIVISTRRGR